MLILTFGCIFFLEKDKMKNQAMYSDIDCENYKESVRAKLSEKDDLK